VPEKDSWITIFLFAWRLNSSNVRNLCLRDAPNLFAKYFFAHPKGIIRIDVRECALTLTGIQPILDYLEATLSSKTLFTDVLLAGTQLAFKTIRAVSLRQFRWDGNIGVDFLDIDL
jgi:hypothetical protein